MKQAEMENVLVNIVCALQELSGREGAEVNSATRPIGDLLDFDSLNGVELTVEVMDKFGIDCDFNNVLVDDGKSLTISEAAARLVKLVGKQ